jgi:uncharacterized protein (TIGR00369 family)
MTTTTLPEGFARHFRQSPLTEPWEPLYSRRVGDAVQIGLTIDAPHTNSRGLVHGGLIAALADNAMGLSCSKALGPDKSLLTVNLGVDYLGTGRIGQWLQIEPAIVKLGASLCFVTALVTADGAPCARANATFMLLRKAA